MTLSGSCPGTVYAQIGAGFRSGPLVLGGAILGGILYTGVSHRLKTTKAKEAKVDTKLTLYEKTGVDANVVFLLFEGGFISAAAAISRLPSTSAAHLYPIFGGLLMGASQLSSLLLTKGTLGISGSYEELGKWFWKFTGASDQKQPTSTSIIFATGLLLGSWALAATQPELVGTDFLDITPVRAITGGIIMAFGSRVAGGCTSGHGISGMALMGVSSIVSVVSMFVGGFASAGIIDLVT
jgi:uncharacterized membrane protein YedE/YeeE